MEQDLAQPIDTTEKRESRRHPRLTQKTNVRITLGQGKRRRRIHAKACDISMSGMGVEMPSLGRMSYPETATVEWDIPKELTQTRHMAGVRLKGMLVHNGSIGIPGALRHPF